MLTGDLLIMFRQLFAPLQIKSMTIRNRIVSTAHNTGLNDGLRIGDQLLAYYEARARGGVGLMIMGSTSVHPSSNSRLKPAFANWDDAVIPEYARLSAAVASHGARIFAQLNHAGAGAGTAGGVGHLVAPSAIESELSPDMPHELEPEQIEEGSVKNLGRYAANWNAFWPKRPSSTAALT